jgi:predicted deacylase
VKKLNPINGVNRVKKIIKRTVAKGAFETPYYLIHGDEKGPTFIVTAGIHGNETASIKAAQKLLHLFENRHLHLIKGTLIIFPIVNQKALQKHIRGNPDLNRTFPQKLNEKALHPLSEALFSLIKLTHPSWVLDLHEANGLSNVNRRFIGQSLITNVKSLSLPVVKKIVNGINTTIKQKTKWFTVRLREKPGSFRTAAERILNTRAITVETCWSLPRAERIEYHLNILRYFLKEAGLIKKHNLIERTMHVPFFYF